MRFKKNILPIVLAAAVLLTSPVKCLNNIRAAETGTTKLGDVNGDNKISILDLITFKAYLNDNSIDGFVKSSADADADGEINSFDVYYVMYYLSGIIGEFGYDRETDTDGDGICDYIEKETLHTDPAKADSDGDGIDDFTEIVILRTNPLDSSASDSGKDFDGDGLSNAEEAKLGLNPAQADTDNDGISDYDEINGLFKKTNPVLWDTDGDGLSDNEEIEMGTDPLNKKTNGKTDDSDLVVSQLIAEDSIYLSYEVKNQPYVFSAEVKASGFAPSHIRVNQSAYTSFADNRYILGDILDIAYDNGNLEQLTVNFRVEGNPEKYCICKYVEESYLLVPVETKYDGNVLSYTESECGTYCLIDMEAWISGFSGNETVSYGVNNAFANNSPASNGIDIYFFKYFPADSASYASAKTFVAEDTSSFVVRKGLAYKEYQLFEKPIQILADYMTTIFSTAKELGDEDIRICGVDEEGLISLRKTNDSNSTIDYVDSKTEYKDIYAMSTNYIWSVDIEEDINSRSSEDFQSDKVNTLIRKPWSFAGALWSTPATSDNQSFSTAIRSDSNRRKICIILDNGSAPSCRNADEAVKELKDLGVEFMFFYPPGSPNAAKYKKFASGQEAYIWNEKTAVKIMMERIFGNKYESNLLSDAYGRKIYSSSDISNYINNQASWTGDESADDDNDGVANIKEIAYSITMGEVVDRYGGGQDWFTNNFSSLEDLKKFLTTPFIVWKSDPNRKDTDNDGVDDSKDSRPEMKLTNQFMVNLNYDTKFKPETLIPAGRVGSYKANTDTVGSESTNLLVLALYQEMCALMDTVCIMEAEMLPNASYFLKRYLANIQKLDIVELKTPFHRAITYTRAQRMQYYNNMNMLMENAENVLRPGDTIDLSNIDGCGGVLFSWGADSNNKFTNLCNTFINKTLIEMDYFLAVSSASNVILSRVTCEEDEKGESVYTARVKYYMFDSYDFDSEPYFHEIALYGMAYPFYTYGVYENEIKWKKDSRYPGYYSAEFVNLFRSDFNDLGIQDKVCIDLAEELLVLLENEKDTVVRAVTYWFDATARWVRFFKENDI